MQSPNYFACHDCGYIFEKSRPDSAAIEEFHRWYPNKDITKAYTVCRRCYELARRILEARINQETWTKYRMSQ